MSITRKDVARRAGVSEATVSYVVNRGPRSVAPATRERVLQAIRELDYHPSDIARSLRKQTTSTIGLIIPDTANPFYGELARVIENVGYVNGYTVVLCNSNFDAEREATYLRMMRNKRADGIIIIPVESRNITAFMDSKIPIVVLEHEIPEVMCIVIDDLAGGRLVTEHLLRLGHQRIGCITRQGDKSSSLKRVVGYTSALAAARIPIDPALILASGPRIADGEAVALELLKRPDPPTAIFAHSDTTALGVLSALHKCGLDVPGQVSVVGYDDIEQAAFLAPPLTTVAYPKEVMGQLAAQSLLELIQSRERSPNLSVLDVTFIERASTGPPPRRSTPLKKGG